MKLLKEACLCLALSLVLGCALGAALTLDSDSLGAVAVGLATVLTAAMVWSDNKLTV